MTNQVYFINYYDMFSLDRTLDEKGLKRALVQQGREVSQKLSSTDPNYIEIKKGLMEMQNIIRNAMRTLSNPKLRKEYDRELAAAETKGQVNHEVNKKAQDILERAHKYFTEGRYALSLKFAQQAVVDLNLYEEDPFDIIIRSHFMLGNYDEAIDYAKKAAEAFSASTHMRWLYIRYLALTENFVEAQNVLNDAIEDFNHASLFWAEQVFLYAYAGNENAMNYTIEEYMKYNPTDVDFRRFVAYDLIDVSQACYKMDSQAEVELITEETDYKRCLNLVTTANRLYQDNTIQDELQRIQFFGELVADDSTVSKQRYYFIGGAILLCYGFWLAMGHGLAAEILLLIAVGLLAVLLGFLVRKTSKRPYWKVYRDGYRGFKDIDESIAYNILITPIRLIKDVLSIFGL